MPVWGVKMSVYKKTKAIQKCDSRSFLKWNLSVDCSAASLHAESFYSLEELSAQMASPISLINIKILLLHDFRVRF